MPYSGPPILPDKIHHYRPAPGVWTVQPPPCGECDFPKAARVHDVPDRSEEDVSDRILGEREQ